MKTKTGLATCLSVVAALSIVPEAFAEQTIYPGTTCQRWGSSNGIAYYSATGRVFNGSYSNKLTVICPIPASNVPNKDVRFAALNQSPKGKVCCHYETRSPAATKAQFVGSEACATKNEGDSIAVSIPTNPFQIPLGGFALLICTIPPKASNTEEAAITLYAVSD